MERWISVPDLPGQDPSFLKSFQLSGSGNVLAFLALERKHRFQILFEEGLSSLVAQRLKHLPPMQETQVWFLGQEDALEKEMVTHSSILAWRIPWMEKPGRRQSTGLQRVGHDWATSLTYFFLCTCPGYKTCSFVSAVSERQLDILLSVVWADPVVTRAEGRKRA